MRTATRWLACALACGLLAACETTRPDYMLGARMPVIVDDVGLLTTSGSSPRPAPQAAPFPIQAGDGADTAPQSAAFAPPAAPPAAQPAVPPAAQPAPAAQRALPTEFWARQRAGFAVPALPAASVAGFHGAYSARPDFMWRTLQRGTPYLPYIAQQLAQRGMPADLALLPVIESAFDPRALSPAAASGIWQFIPETGRRYGLQRTWLRDDRRDAFAATGAALDYLNTMYRQFGDWHLALAGYNCGEGCVGRALSQARAAGLGRDFTAISAWLPAETRAYVPRFIAVRDIVANPAAFRVTLPVIDAAPRVVRITIDRDADLGSIARVSGAPMAELRDLNAGALRQVVPQGQNIWMHEHRATQLVRSLQADEEGKLTVMQLKPVQAKPGERLSAFAQRLQTTVADLREINGISPALGTIQSGTLFVPLLAGETPPSLRAAEWPALRMQGEEELMARGPQVAEQDKALLAAHPHWVESGYTPGRLRLLGKPPRKR